MEIVILEKNFFSKLVENYRKSLHIVEFMTYLSDYPLVMGSHLTMTETCKAFNITRTILREASKKKLIRKYQFNNKVYYKASDIIDLKCLIYKLEFEPILNKFTNDDSVLTESVKNNILRDKVI